MKLSMDNYKSIIINGTSFTGEALDLLCNDMISNSKLPDWEKNIYAFILDWISPASTITVSTSGSTGTPKEIAIKKKSMIASALGTIVALNLSKQDTAWLCLPVHYIAGIMMIVRAIVGELNLVYTEPSNIPFLDDSINPDFVAMVPNQVASLMESEKGTNILENINKVLIGGSIIHPSLEKQIIDNKNITVWHSYGMTETITHIALRKLGSHTHIGDFIPLKDVSINLNKENQLIISYPEIGVIDLLTNDIAQIYEDGSFSILGRKDDIIISGGIKIHPEIIEKIIKETIKPDLFLYGITDKVLGQKLVLFVESNRHELSIDELREKTGRKLNKYQIPKEIIHIPRFIRTESGKTIREATIRKFYSDKV